MYVRILLLAAFVAVLLGAVPTLAEERAKHKHPTREQFRIAHRIANGHSYDKHVVAEEQFPEVKDREEFAELIARVQANAPYSKELGNGREAFYDPRANIIVIVNPHARDWGTAFRPSARKRYFDNLR